MWSRWLWVIFEHLIPLWASVPPRPKRKEMQAGFKRSSRVGFLAEYGLLPVEWPGAGLLREVTREVICSGGGVAAL